MSYGSGVRLVLLCAVLLGSVGFQILFSIVLSTVPTENFRSLGQNMGQKLYAKISVRGITVSSQQKIPVLLYSCFLS